jgi:Flp pilus assembly protein TadD
MAWHARSKRSWRKESVLAAAMAAFLLAGCAHTPESEVPHKDVTADSLIQAAKQTQAAGDSAAAALLYERALAMDPKNLEAALQLGTIYGQIGATRQSMEFFRQALTLDPKNVTALRGLANGQLQLGDPDAAISTLQKAAAIQPDWRIQNSLGVAYDMKGDYQAAQAAYRSGLTMAPGNLQLSSNLGLSLALDGNFDEALPMLEKAARDPSATPRIRQNLALAYGLAGDDARAAEVAKLDLNPAQVQANLGFYEYLRLLHDRKAVAAAIGAHQAGEGAP